jgi:hypothetical protein
MIAQGRDLPGDAIRRITPHRPLHPPAGRPASVGDQWPKNPEIDKCCRARAGQTAVPLCPLFPMYLSEAEVETQVTAAGLSGNIMN